MHEIIFSVSKYSNSDVKMWRSALISVLLNYFIVINVTTAPVYSNLHGTQYTVSNADHRPYIEVHNSTYHGTGPREEARAMCSVRTHEVNATANATITRKLHGVVTSRELHSSIQRLELIIFGQMQQLWQSLDALRAQLGSDAHTLSRAATPSRKSVSFHIKPNY